ncbi:hypothetical protein HYU21_04215 [Candidatus Woesearchaeota archaeon]|nr:hypothetical protein [Candidatus Woesearchaeota archaeon]
MWKSAYISQGNSEASNYNSSERLDFQQLSKFIREMFPADKYIFWGAELHRPPVDLDSRDKTTRMIWEQKNNISYGCVIFYYDILDLPSKFIDERYCCVFDW